MNLFDIQPQVGFITNHYTSGRFDSQFLDEAFAINDVRESPIKDSGNPFFNDDMTDDLGLLKDVEDDVDFNIQRVLASSSKSSASGNAVAGVHDNTPLMSPAPSAVPEFATSAFAVDGPVAEPDTPSESLIEFEESVAVTGGAECTSLPLDMGKSLAVGDAQSLSQNGAEGKMAAVIDAHTSIEPKGLLLTEPIQEGDAQIVHQASIGRPDDARGDTGSTTDNGFQGFGSGLGDGSGESDLIEYVEEDDEENEDEHQSGDTPKVTEDVLEGEAQSSDAFEYAPLPCVLLSYRGEVHALFNVYQDDLDLKPIFDDEQQGPILFESQLTSFITELKHHFEIESDISLEIPALDLTLHEEMNYAQTLSLNRLYEFYMASLAQRGEPMFPEKPFKVNLIEHGYSLEQRLSDLVALAAEAGFPATFDELDDTTSGDGIQSENYQRADETLEEETFRIDDSQVSGSDQERVFDAQPGLATPTSLNDTENQGNAGINQTNSTSNGSSPTRTNKRLSEDSGYEGEVKRARI
ncbi:uncharacterized protein SPPG_06598 [Spizellomyces punctatus DAOM BR117]|uniref:Uncharacterized protein n=1 Tax=Spizellomyces punctatus (strain DAOM BR117) TaxID=645134 RepID=A0A0L0HB90_SPIPD|nr:uncharacterized protein SPPG_06598 [Spizellomyces punctatus DAOM BR117]KNC98196.1 hypothetical protein SPPG_06598 [Spizellomyces punctatus DAOM BR117]|eukprot:XP_016606236.1 hypothetical protein SPPG_06598 [Spizellomyces punctatus DAOM BR117]